MKGIERELKWRESETGIKFRQMKYGKHIIRCMVRSENDGAVYRVICQIYDKNGNTVSSAAETFKTVYDPETVFENLKTVYYDMVYMKPSFEKFLAASL